MKQLEKELDSIKTELINMWELVSAQVGSSRECLINFDKDLAREIQIKEKRVNSAELNIDQDCENVFALYSPVAVDLRFLLSILKINSNLERVGDIADGIAKYIIAADVCFKSELLTATRVMEMFDVGLNMLKITLLGFEREDTVMARSIFAMDEVLDEINSSANTAIMDYLKNHPVYYAGPAKTPAGYATGSFGPTTAGRMDSYVAEFQAAGGSLIMLAKGNRSKAVKDACKAHGGFYLGSVGGPAARLAQDCIRKVETLEYPELGMEAVWRIEVENFPAFIVIDDKGNDFYEGIE